MDRGETSYHLQLEVAQTGAKEGGEEQGGESEQEGNRGGFGNGRHPNAEVVESDAGGACGRVAGAPGLIAGPTQPEILARLPIKAGERDADGGGLVGGEVAVETFCRTRDFGDDVAAGVRRVIGGGQLVASGRGGQVVKCPCGGTQALSPLFNIEDKGHAVDCRSRGVLKLEAEVCGVRKTFGRINAKCAVNGIGIIVIGVRSPTIGSAAVVVLPCAGASGSDTGIPAGECDVVAE